MNKNSLSKYFFVLGAPDHEMQAIRAICKEEGLLHGHATVGGDIVHSYDAYAATGINALLPTGEFTLVFVECAVMGLPRQVVIDHHQPGDPGFGKQPHEYLEGSSLGQFLKLLGKEPTQEQRVIAAADHCLTAAYQGQCPGVTPDELQSWREKSRAAARGIPPERLRQQIAEALECLKTAPTLDLEGVAVAWFDGDPPREVSEASARAAFPYAYIKHQEDGRVKSGIRSAPASAVAYWIANCGLKNTYGDPQRGFAGGYF